MSCHLAWVSKLLGARGGGGLGGSEKVFLASPQAKIPDACPLGTIAVTVRSGISKRLILRKNRDYEHSTPWHNTPIISLCPSPSQSLFGWDFLILCSLELFNLHNLLFITMWQEILTGKWFFFSCGNNFLQFSIVDLSAGTNFTEWWSCFCFFFYFAETMCCIDIHV